MSLALTLLLAVVWPALAGTRAQASRLMCQANLREIGLAYHQWSASHGDFYPFVLTAENGGIRTPYNGLEGNSWFQFSWVSNELRTARILACPSDDRRVADDFSFGTTGLLHSINRNNSISYFLTYAAQSGARVLSGDRNIRFEVTSTCTYFGPGRFPSITRPSISESWDGRQHQDRGNLLYTDGSTETVGTAGLRQEFRTVESGSAHVLVP